MIKLFKVAVPGVLTLSACNAGQSANSVHCDAIEGKPQKQTWSLQICPDRRYRDICASPLPSSDEATWQTLVFGIDTRGGSDGNVRRICSPAARAMIGNTLTITGYLTEVPDWTQGDDGVGKPRLKILVPMPPSVWRHSFTVGSALNVSGLSVAKSHKTGLYTVSGKLEFDPEATLAVVNLRPALRLSLR